MNPSEDKALTLSQVHEWLNVAEGLANLSATVRPDADLLRDLWRRQRPITEVAPVSATAPSSSDNSPRSDK